MRAYACPHPKLGGVLVFELLDSYRAVLGFDEAYRIALSLRHMRLSVVDDLPDPLCEEVYSARLGEDRNLVVAGPYGGQIAAYVVVGHPGFEHIEPLTEGWNPDWVGRDDLMLAVSRRHWRGEPPIDCRLLYDDGQFYLCLVKSVQYVMTRDEFFKLLDYSTWLREDLREKKRVIS